MDRMKSPTVIEQLSTARLVIPMGLIARASRLVPRVSVVG